MAFSASTACWPPLSAAIGQAASVAALDSLWATEVPMRAIVIAAALKNG